MTIQNHDFLVEGSEFYSLQEFFAANYEEVQRYIHKIGERFNGLAGIPADSFSRLAQLNYAALSKKKMEYLVNAKWLNMTW